MRATESAPIPSAHTASHVRLRLLAEHFKIVHLLCQWCKSSTTKSRLCSLSECLCDCSVGIPARSRASGDARPRLAAIFCTTRYGNFRPHGEPLPLSLPFSLAFCVLGESVRT